MNAIEFENISKLYRLGRIGTGTLSHDLNRWWYRVRGKEDPYLKIGQVNDRTKASHEGDYVWALKDITFNVEQGDVVGIIGKNGAGKSTLLKILSKVTTPTTGIIRARGRIASLLEVGTGFHDEMTGRENIYMNGTIMGMTKVEVTRKLDEIVDFAGVAMYLDTPVKRYSSGMKVRLGFAVAAFLEPEILVVDEVLAVGDAEFQKKAIGKMQDVSRGEGRTVLFVSHNMAAVRNLCKSAIVLRDGQIILNDDVETAVANYLRDNQLEISNISPLYRKGDGLMRFSEVIIKDEKGNARNIFCVGESVVIEIHFLDNGFGKEKQSRIEFWIKNINEETVAWDSTAMYIVDLNSYKDYVKLRIDKIALTPGQYSFSFRSKTMRGISDWVENLAKIEIVSQQLYGNGCSVVTHKGYLVLDCRLM